MTKCLYAMLVQQKFNPEKKTGWDLVDSSNPQYKAQITGIKIVKLYILFLLCYKNFIYVDCTIIYLTYNVFISIYIYIINIILN